MGQGIDEVVPDPAEPHLADLADGQLVEPERADVGSGPGVALEVDVAVGHAAADSSPDQGVAAPAVGSAVDGQHGGHEAPFVEGSGHLCTALEGPACDGVGWRSPVGQEAFAGATLSMGIEFPRQKRQRAHGENR